MICALNKKVFDPHKRLNDMKILAYLEWYKRHSKFGYYDSYKNKRFLEDMDVNRFKKKLNDYWEKMVAEAERMSQKDEAAFRSRWLHGETAYRRMVEPLDIADYYHKGYKDYITKGRSQHYIKLEKWLEEGRPHKQTS
ncbi:hypothetical protein Ddye_015037 [Dipteronia dyeriana]|uniref:EDS1 EP domain-containing protein n=1 Tax=Dipteronia dyeriana TaxID=168575 RepID=A0AAD9U4S4_9ROSI|nr:hypothetical protein Ddye_015037 [Dipteronia dyeriana]